MIGWDQSRVADVETARRRVGVFELIDIANALGCDPVELLRQVRDQEQS